MRAFNTKEIKLTLAMAALCALLAGAAYAVVHRDGRGAGDRYAAVERAPVSEARERPNIVLVYTDDQNFAEFNRRYMPRTVRLLGDGGTVFDNFVVATPVCCPSRAAALTGSYPHNNGVFSNKNGWDRLRDEQANLGTWMQRAGYRTAWLGKFLQGYKESVGDPSVAAPGFDDWLVSVRPKFFGYKLHSNERPHKIKGGHGPRSYYTDKLTRKARKLIAGQVDEPRPLFMVLNHLAPHRGAGGKGRCAGTVAPSPRDFGRFGEESLPRPPSFGRVAATKTAFSEQAGLGSGDVAELTAKVRCRAESLLAVDRSVASIYRTFERAGELDRTVFAFTSDNGLLLGEHGLTGKSIPYEEGIRMPLALRVPPPVLGERAAARVDELAANIDLAPTLLDLAGASPCTNERACRTLDGRSLVPLLRGAGEWPRDRGIVIEGGDHGENCAYRGLRLADEVLLERVRPAGKGCAPDGDPELYDLARDPYQLRNLAAGDAGHRRALELRARLDELSRCAGVEGRDKRTDGRPFCK
jgi:arylsulfatase A-like enzyme